MKLEMELGGAEVQELKFFADAVIWNGEALKEDIQGRMMLCDMVPDPGDKCPELKRLTVLDECAKAANARLDVCPNGDVQVVGRLEIPLEAEFADDCGNTYFCRCTANYNVSIIAKELTRESCGEVVLRCEAKELNVQATSRECVAYQLKLDVRAYLTRKALIELELEDEEEVGSGPVVVRETGYTRMPSGAGTISGSGCNCGVPVMGDVARATGLSSKAGYTLDSLAAGAARNCCANRPTPPCPPPAPPCPAPVPPCADVDNDEDCRTLVKMPIHRRRR